MIKTLRNIFRQDKERFVVPKGVQDVIPITAIYDDGIFRVGKDKFTKTFKFTDINYAVASNEDKCNNEGENHKKYDFSHIFSSCFRIQGRTEEVSARKLSQRSRWGG